jgi:DNA-binding winged helix-turn-helix (wHTH) protein
MTAANLRPSHASDASVFERSGLDVSIEAETVGGPAGSQGNKPVQLGSRALDLLIALVRRPSELVTKEELMTRVWPKIFVHPANLAVHISALRRALRDGQDGNRFFVNVPGRGYIFVAPVKVHGGAKPSHPASPSAPLHNPPALVDGLITEEPVAGLSPGVSHNRLITVAGYGSKQQQSDRRRRPLRAGLPQRPTTKSGKDAHERLTTGQ